MEFPEGLGLAVICEREDPRDAFVSNTYRSLDELPEGAIVGTSSLRRQCQLLKLRPDLTINFLRGNVNTRLAKLDEGQYDAIILAAAGLIRLEFQHRITAFMDIEQSLPAGGQGAVGIECRMDDSATRALIAPLHHEETANCVLAERALVRHLQGGCQVPIASYAIQQDDELYLRGIVARPDASTVLNAQLRGSVADCEEIGVSVAKALLQQGAGEILEDLYHDPG